MSVFVKVKFEPGSTAERLQAEATRLLRREARKAFWRVHGQAKAQGTPKKK